MSWESFREMICHMVFSPEIFDSRITSTVVTDFLTTYKIALDETENQEIGCLKLLLNTALKEAYKKDKCRIKHLFDEDNCKSAAEFINALYILHETGFLNRGMVCFPIYYFCLKHNKFKVRVLDIYGIFG